MTQPTQSHHTPIFNPPNTPPHILRSHLRRDGFVLVRGLLSDAELSRLRGAASRLVSRARAGRWPHVRTTGKQFPPWNEEDYRQNPAHIWGVQHLLSPDLPVGGDGEGEGELDRGIFWESYFGAVLDVAKGLLSSSGDDDDDDDDTAAVAAAHDNNADDQETVTKLTTTTTTMETQDSDLVMELYNMLIDPRPSSFSLRWHRDDIPATATPEEEVSRLRDHPPFHAQWNLALLPRDRGLIVVPGSHARARTQAERDADPYEEGLEGELVVELDEGDVVFYDNNILHRGKYECVKSEGGGGVGEGALELYEERRMTLHGSVGHVRAGKARARNVLQHAVGGWVGRCEFEEMAREAGDAAAAAVGKDGGDERGEVRERMERMRVRAEGMRERLVRLGSESGDVGYAFGDE